jgi:hypothetical protein
MVQKTDFQSPPLDALQGTMWCQHCDTKAPVHMCWFRVHEDQATSWVEGKTCCDGCLAFVVEELSQRRRMRGLSGLVTSPVRVVLL